MRTTMAILAGLTVFAAVSVQAAPFSPTTMTSAELRSAPAMELIRQGCGGAGTAPIGVTAGVIGIGAAVYRVGKHTRGSRRCIGCGPCQAG